MADLADSKALPASPGPEAEQGLLPTALSSGLGLRKGAEAPAPWALALHSLLLKETKQTIMVLARVDSSHGRGSCGNYVFWTPQGGCHGGGDVLLPEKDGHNGWRGISRALGIGVGREEGTGQFLQVREGQPAGSGCYSRVKTVPSVKVSSLGKILLVGSRVFLWGEGP